MIPGTLETPRYASLRKGGKVLGRLALWVQLGFLITGMGLFLDQAQDLLSDAQFTWGERRVMGVIALVTLGGCGLAGWILGQLFRVSAELLDVLADGAEAAWRAGDLIEQHLVPTLGRIALALEERDGSAGLRPATPTSAASVSTKAIRTEMAAAQAAGRAGRVIELRDSLTQHLRGEPLHALDRELALWMLNLVERRIRAGTVDVEVAGWVARAARQLRRHARGRARFAIGLAGPAPSRGIVPEMRAARVAARKPFAPIAGPGAVPRRYPPLHCSIVLDPGALMSSRVRCTSCRTAFLTPIDEPGATVECPSAAPGIAFRSPPSARTRPNRRAPSPPAGTPSASVFVPSGESQTRSSRRRWFVGLRRPGDCHTGWRGGPGALAAAQAAQERPGRACRRGILAIAHQGR